MNVELLRMVQKQIVEHPKSFRMDHWNCGTAQCIAGHALTMTGHAWEQSGHDKYMGLVGGGFISRIAGDELGLGSDQRCRLFYTHDWPDDLEEQYAATDDYAERARIASERIDHFIATDGAE